MIFTFVVVCDEGREPTGQICLHLYKHMQQITMSLKSTTFYYVYPTHNHVLINVWFFFVQHRDTYLLLF